MVDDYQASLLVFRTELFDSLKSPNQVEEVHYLAVYWPPNCSPLRLWCWKGSVPYV
jgi:hypothetical protein